MSKQWIIVALVVMAAIVGFFYFNSTLDKITKVANVIETFDERLKVNTNALDQALEQLEYSKRETDSIDLQINANTEMLYRIEQKLNELPDYEVPEAQEYEPEDYEECLDAISEIQQINERLRDIVNLLQRENTYLRSSNKAQADIIESQVRIIEIQKKDISTITLASEDIVKQANREKWLGYTVAGVAIVGMIVF